MIETNKTTQDEFDCENVTSATSDETVQNNQISENVREPINNPARQVETTVSKKILSNQELKELVSKYVIDKTEQINIS